MIGTAIHSWQDFDGWCVVKNFDPLNLSGRRFISAILFWLKEHKDEKQLKEMERTLDESARVENPLITQFRLLNRPIKQERKQETTSTSYTKWKAPPGWKPPGWQDDRTAYQNAKKAMGFIQNPK